YWCLYGLDENRNKPATGEKVSRCQIKSGCQCHFDVKGFYGRPKVAIMLYNNPFNCDVNNERCHGRNENNINDTRVNVAPYLSNECKIYIEILLLMGVTMEMVYEKYIEDPSNVSILRKRDQYLTRNDVVNAWKRVNSKRSQKHVDDDMS
ncbi:hypothetical protein KI387_023458, partial [Taxus chinensis]